MEPADKKKRSLVNLFSFLTTCLFLFLAVQFSDGVSGAVSNFATKINKITDSLDKAVLGLSTDVNYTDYNAKTDYLSVNTSFETKGMAGLYNITTLFIKAVMPKDILMQGLVTVDKNKQIHLTYDYADLMWYYQTLVALLVFLALCVVLFPLFFLFFCCCRCCCGNCGARSQPADKKKDLCKKLCQGTVLIVLATGLLFGVVCAFVSNEQMQEGIRDFPNNMNNSIQDTGKYLNHTSGEINHLLVDNYNEFSDALFGVLDNASVAVTSQLEEYSNATAMLQLLDFAHNLTNVQTTLEDLKTSSNRLRVYASQLNDALRKVKKDLTTTLQDCKLDPCNAVRNNVSLLQTNIDFNKYVDRYFPRLPDLSDSITSIEGLGIEDIQTAAENGNENLNNVKKQIADSLKTGIGSAKSQITKSGQDIKTKMNDVTDMINEFQTSLTSTTKEPLEKANDYIAKYGMYRYYAGLTVACVLLLVTVCIALGLICGICGKRPDGFSDNCCNKGAGSQFLICAVVIMFIFGFVISVMTLVSVVVGIVSDKAVCSTFKNPSGSNIMQVLDDLVEFDSFKVSFSSMLKNCHSNQSVYTTFNLKDKFNIAEVRSQFNISEQLSEFNLNKSMFDNFKILDEGNMRIMDNLKNFQTPNLDKFTDELSAKFTNYNLNQLSDKIQEVIDTMKKTQDPGYEDTIRNLQLSQLHLSTYNEKILDPMRNLATQVMTNATELDSMLKMGSDSFNDAVNDLLDKIVKAQDYLLNHGADSLINITDNFKGTIITLVDGYMDRVEYQITNEVGTCGPLSAVINSTLTSTCDKILLPWNGFWFSMFWSILLYIVTIVVAIKLATLYQKYKPYGHGYVETRAGKRGKKKGKKSKRYEERHPPNAGHGAVARGSHPVDGRYDDMAPKPGIGRIFQTVGPLTTKEHPLNTRGPHHIIIQDQGANNKPKNHRQDV
ncbi:prominin-like protein isoform X4 [Sitophilus oryzae]|uniref:Prominin-like protein isoform X4 n=1 Tax=Sitophilus oryzae TaxID=7048 RepID=A0A6J2Y691_SITOR|nr:prominin-like protein isoform X4 [Sitophilus oryzae]